MKLHIFDVSSEVLNFPEGCTMKIYDYLASNDISPNHISFSFMEKFGKNLGVIFSKLSKHREWLKRL